MDQGRGPTEDQGLTKNQGRRTKDYLLVHPVTRDDANANVPRWARHDVEPGPGNRPRRLQFEPPQNLDERGARLNQGKPPADARTRTEAEWHVRAGIGTHAQPSLWRELVGLIPK